MPSAQHTVTIKRPPDDVFAYVLDGEKCPEWRPGVTDIKRISGDGGVGTVYGQGVRGPMGRRVAADYRVTVCQPNRVLEFQTVAGPVRPHGRFEIAPEGDGTRLTLSLDADVNGIFALFMGRTVQRTMDNDVHAIERMKANLEGMA
jgi:carbon monoxide dehydrogenase subunit G